MRYDTPIYLQTLQEGSYNPETGNYEGEQTSEIMALASVMDTQTEMLTLVYGKLQQGSLTVQLQNCTEPFDRIRIGSKVYAVDYCRTLRTKQTFVVSEVQG